MDGFHLRFCSQQYVENCTTVTTKVDPMTAFIEKYSKDEEFLESIGIHKKENLDFCVAKPASFQHSSMFGTYITECEIFKENKDRVYIRYTDPWTKEIVERWIKKLYIVP